MAEQLLVDGIAVNLNSTEGSDLQIVSLNFPTPEARYQWVGTGDSEGEQLVGAPKHNNRRIEAKVRVKASASLDAAWDLLAPLVDKFAKAASTPEGIALAYVPDGSSRTVVFDLLAGEINGQPL